MLSVFLLRAYLAINIFIAVCTMESVSIFVTASLISYDFSALMHVYSFEHLKIILCNLIESNQHNVAKCNLDKVKLRASVVSGLLLKRARLWSDRKGLLVILGLMLHLTLAFFGLIFVDLSRKWIFADSGSQPVPPLLCRWVFPLNSFSWRLHAGVVPVRRFAKDTSLLCLMRLGSRPTFKASVPKLIYWWWV